ncbi:pantothenate synthetase [Moorella thermoacetica]|uniref:Pantothenate synthetase n=1 Tax=Moorella thermoacetica (strain ATCC 39073 / JCM 9320) TaxID=264732 RepID=PANC_MOOTA|nr:pantoate--beta-alanine ligase [Moorella thermoacetica]Q2RM60.1 RecName: Full=Pantothenate synthetase; Short=PS; AltName: Full=Pantoate--beta-alanine ligase; AltName: Full=Pantoate-activating enzyme [Moorella thermoacetica ATCC 39073]AKX92970.1 pantothenate synthetase [Moorella thermoacetica]AKX95523.1 pantothenate synthetase [Moorella thermoacetica]OIQ56979.1 pantothenate synthetase [Moorella thermoacetica]QCZ99331.1 Pantothenate synthetase [Moorella thermoacetica]TYL09019.1 Pantothenate s
MELLQTIAAVRNYVAAARQRGLSIGLVPTMGYLHEGHLSLARAARQQNDVVIMSIFVNPTQFGPNEDFARYPRDLERDRELAAGAGVDAVFAPAVEEMYPAGYATYVQVEGLTEVLCGASRPGHFRGVTTVVSKLFNIVQPDRAYFGQKDYQQALVIKRMVRDLNFPIEIITIPTVREADGLALSSRNKYLTPEQRRSALSLHRALHLGSDLIKAGEREAAVVRRAMEKEITAWPETRIDYVAISDADTLKPLEKIAGRVLLALAVWVGNTRLIDNVVLEVND